VFQASHYLTFPMADFWVQANYFYFADFACQMICKLD
jgi:hypothetical protein